MPEYTKAKVQCTQDKHTSAEQLLRALLLPLSLSEYVDTHSLPTGYLRPQELDMTLQCLDCRVDGGTKSGMVTSSNPCVEDPKEKPKGMFKLKALML